VKKAITPIITQEKLLY